MRWTTLTTDKVARSRFTSTQRRASSSERLNPVKIARCNHCNPSKNDLDLIEWWAIQGKTLEILGLGVLTVYIRNMFRLLSDEDRLYEPAPGPTLWLLERFAASLPTLGHTEAFTAINARGLLQLVGQPAGR